MQTERKEAVQVWSSSDKFYSTFLLQNAEHPRFNAKIERKAASQDPKFSVETATQLATFLANRPDVLARVCDALARSDTVDQT
jgi:hypothetical protein